MSILATLKGIPFTHCRDASSECFGLFWPTVLEVKRALKLLNATLANLKINRDLLYERTRRNYSTVTELANGYLLIPLLVLIYVLVVVKATPMRAALWGIVAAFFVSFVRRETAMTPKKLIQALSKGAQDVLSMVAACATAGIIIGVLNLTGAGLKFASAIVDLAGGNLPVALVMTMLASIILGMGLPTTAAYLVTAAVVAPALIQMGLSPLAAHMFVFFFACISAITPPVALAAYAGANLAKAKPSEVAVTATMLGITAFLVPYMFVYGEELLWNGSALQILRVMITSIVGVSALAIGIQGWLFGGRMLILPRVLLIIAALNLINSKVSTDIIGAVLIIGALIMEKVFHRRGKTDGSAH